jgi:hypothetical protein
MADVSSIKLPNNTVVNIKDTTARSGLDQKITKPSTDGTSGQVLTANGTGGTYWSSVSGGAGDIYSTSDGQGNVVITLTEPLDGNNMDF